MDIGILTIATGKKRYIDMAKTLAISLKLNFPDVSRALVTDSDDPELKNLFDHIILPDKEIQLSFLQKTNIYNYSPYKKTLFIDADCMVVRDIRFLFDLFDGKPVSVMGKTIKEGVLFGTDLNKIKNTIAFDFIPVFNGGVYYFEKNLMAQKVFEDVLFIIKNYEHMGINKHRGDLADEPIMALAMGMNHMLPVDDKNSGMYTPVGQHGQFRMDVLKGYCEFMKREQLVKPAIMHFGGGYPEAFHYRREKAKLKLVYYYKLPRFLASPIINITWNPTYVMYVFVYRLIKKVVKGGKLKLKPLLPMFRFE